MKDEKEIKIMDNFMNEFLNNNLEGTMKISKKAVYNYQAEITDLKTQNNQLKLKILEQQDQILNLQAELDSQQVLHKNDRRIQCCLETLYAIQNSLNSQGSLTKNDKRLQSCFGTLNAIQDSIK